VLKQISISDLMVDMYVADIVETSSCQMPKRRKGMIRDSRIISKFIEVGVERVVIDTAKGLDVSAIESANDEHNKALIDTALEEKLDVLKGNLSSEYQDLSLEWGSAKEIFRTSTKIVLQSVSAIQEGGTLNQRYFDEASKAISRSIMRNRDALTWLGKLRHERSYLFEHSVNTATLMGIFARESGLSLTQTEACITGALLHDLGQVKIEAELLERMGPVTEPEFEEIKKHVELGESLLPEGADISSIARSIIGEHHERYDGSGYPNGLKGKEISIYGRMFAIVDTYDALTNNRGYKKAVPSSQGMRTLLELSKTQYDEVLVHQFIKCMGIYPTGSLARLDSGLLAVVIAQNPGHPLKPLVKAVYNTVTSSYVKPELMDLARTDCPVKIHSYEDPKNHGIDVDEFMPDELLED